MMSILRFGAFAFAAAVIVVAPVAAEAANTPTVLGTFKDWTAFSTDVNGGKLCFVSGRPRSMEPAKAKRDPVYFLVSNWTARKAKGEPEIVPGYSYKDGSNVVAKVGATSVTFFTRNDADGGQAWVQEAGDEARLVSAMRSGAQIVVTGTSRRGTLTTDTYSLAGISDALDKINAECGM